MNIGLIILLTSLFVGAEDNNDQPAEIKKPNSERITKNEDVVKNNISINQSDEIPQNTSGIDKSVNKKNSPPTIQGEPKVKINQDEYYSFTPLVNDPENDKLEFDITNKPQWAIFDSRTGTLFGQPTNNDSVNDIYQLFKDVDLDEIYAWIEVATQYSRYGESLNYSGKAEDVVPILFKGNNPYSGEFNGNTYWKGYMQ